MCMFDTDIPEVKVPKYEPPKIEIPSFEVPEVTIPEPLPAPTPSADSPVLGINQRREEGPGRTAARQSDPRPYYKRKGTQGLRIPLDGASQGVGLQIPLE